jgi:tubulin-specific chaperone D
MFLFLKFEVPLVHCRTFTIAGILATVANMLKTGSRKVVMGVVQDAFTNITALSSTGELVSNSLGRKLALKVQQRCALTLLDPLRMNSIAQNTMRHKRKGAIIHSEGDVEVLALTEMGIDLLPRIIDVLLQGLCDIDTIVRWSAAKGLGRIAARLPSSCVEDINNAILELFSPLQLDSGWQGACLAIAEVARQGLLPVQGLAKVCSISPRLPIFMTHSRMVLLMRPVVAVKC